MLKKEILIKYRILFYTIISIVVYIFLQKVAVVYFLKSPIARNIYDLRNISSVTFAFVLDGINAIAGVLLLYLIGRQDWKNVGFKFRKKDIHFTLIGVALLILMHILFTYLTSKMNLASWNFEFSKQIVPLYLLYAILTRFLFVGIGEEFLYRGYLFKALEPYGRLVQYGVNLLFFVSVHFLGNEIYPVYFLELIIATLCLCYIYEKTGSIWPGVILHGALDLLVTLFYWNVKGVSIVGLWWKSKYNAGNAFQWLYIVSSILIIILVWYVYERQSRKYSIKNIVNN